MLPWRAADRPSSHLQLNPFLFALAKQWLERETHDAALPGEHPLRLTELWLRLPEAVELLLGQDEPMTGWPRHLFGSQDSDRVRDDHELADAVGARSPTS